MLCADFLCCPIATLWSGRLRAFLSPSSLVAGLILAESHFDKDAVSHAGAVGLMQLTPDTYHWLCFKLGHEEGDLSDVNTNLYYGCANLALLLSEFSDLPTALAAYNAGPRPRAGLACRHALQHKTGTLFPMCPTLKPEHTPGVSCSTAWLIVCCMGFLNLAQICAAPDYGKAGLRPLSPITEVFF